MNKTKKILVVEDDAPSAFLLSQMLKKMGYEVLGPIDTGEKAIEEVAGQKPDLVLLDITLKGEMDGISTAQVLREQNPVPIIYLTVSADDNTIQRAKETVPYGYILKPYNRNMIGATVEMALYKIDMEHKLRDIEERNEAILASLPDTVFYTTRMGDIPDENEKKASHHLWTEKVAERARPVIRETLESQKTGIFNYALTRKGEVLYYEARIIPSGDRLALVIVRDVTSKKIIENRQADYRKVLEEQVKNRTRDLTAMNENLEREVGLRRKIEQSMRIFGHAIEQNPLIVVIINKEGNVEYVNSAFTDLSGFGRNQVVGTNVSQPGNHIIPEPELWDNMIGVKKWTGESYSMKRDGGLYYLNTRVSSIIGEDGEISHYIITGEDITQAKREKMALDQAKETLDKTSMELLNRELDWKEWKVKMLQRNVSRTDKSLFKNIHNSFTQGAGFGTLVTLIDLMTSGAETTADGKLVVDARVVDMIQNNLNLVKDAFKTFTSIDWIISNEFETQKTSLYDLYEVAKIVKSNVEEYAGLNKNRIIINEFNYRYKDLFVNLNKEYFSKALFEILVNAMKFSKKNSYITIFINVMGKDAVVSVVNDPEKSDEGIVGIPVEYERVVFEPFYRLTKVVHEQYNTLEFGLGLTLVEKIIGKLGGEVTARNIVDHSDSRRESQEKVNVSLTLPLLET
ncbi:MAG TPA: response regulator [Spirochaetota bacterium]|nr:response regulator [Spirochaetota bacterium]